MKLADMAKAIDFRRRYGVWYDSYFVSVAYDEDDYFRGKTYLSDGVSVEATILNNKELRKAYKLFKAYGEDGMWERFDEVFDD